MTVRSRLKRNVPRTLWVAALLIVCVSVAMVVIYIPRPSLPVEPPALALSARAAEAVLARDAVLAETVPESEATIRLDRLYREVGLAEVRGGQTPAQAVKRSSAVRAALRAVRAAHGTQAVAAMRARYATALEGVLFGGVPEPERSEVLGTFPRMLERYGATRDRKLNAPYFVARTLYKARWNIIHWLAPTSGMARVEQHAYWGWLALGAERASVESRLDALSRYAALGGQDTLEARGYLLYRAGRLDEAARTFSAGYEQTGSLRFRNYALGVLDAAGARDE